MSAKRSVIQTDPLAQICELLELARDYADELPSSIHPSHVELIEALSTSRLCALRLAAERVLEDEALRAAPSSASAVRPRRRPGAAPS